jgi:hypothetical protein
MEPGLQNIDDLVKSLGTGISKERHVNGVEKDKEPLEQNRIKIKA